MVRILTVHVSDDRDDEEEPPKVAEVSVADDDSLTLVSAEPGFADKLNRAIAEVNAAEYLFRVVLPPADAPRYALAKEMVMRGHHGFLEAIGDNLARFHGLALSLG